jgi:hypothetical protein
MKVGIFYNSISNPGKFSNKVMLMDNFRDGVKVAGDQVLEFRNTTLPKQQLDVGFVLGYTLENNFRKTILNTLHAQNTPPVFVDSNILHYSRPEHEWHRYSLNTVYPGTGVYFFNNLDNTKWQKYSTWHNTSIKPWRTNGNHILIFCQRPNGWNMFGNNQEEWLDQIIRNIKRYSNRPIVIRMHPGDKTRFVQIEKIKQRYGNSVSISTHENIRDALVNCWCAVGYNSTPNAVAPIEGIPVFVTDPVNSWAKDVAFTDISQIENPPLPDRTEWINKIANIHWSNDEVRSGKLWASIKQYISASR